MNKTIRVFKIILTVLISLLLCASVALTTIGIINRPKRVGAVRGVVHFSNINGNDVDVEVLTRYAGDAYYNPNFREAEMIYGAIAYKKEHKDANVSIKLTSFHISVVAAACIKKDSDKYGLMKSLYDEDYDKDFVRISYLLVLACKYGINTTVIGQVDASAVWQSEGPRADYHFDEYFQSKMNESCVEGVQGKVGDYLRFKKCFWTSYGDRSAADMFHTKFCTVSHCLIDGEEKFNGLWQSATNLDGIDAWGGNGNNNMQSGVVIWGHKELFTITNNMIDLAFNYCGQEDAVQYRKAMREKSQEQYNKLINGEPVNLDEQIIYIGTETDKVFEMYFTPLYSTYGSWDTNLNPYTKYISKMADSTDYIIFSANNANFSDAEFNRIWNQTVLDAFVNVNNPKSRLNICYDTHDFDFSAIELGKNAEFITFAGTNNHSKDIQVSYKDENIRHYVSVLATTNCHEGAMAYQANSYIVIKENEKTGANFFNLFGKYTSHGAIE